MSDWAGNLGQCFYDAGIEAFISLVRHYRRTDRPVQGLTTKIFEIAEKTTDRNSGVTTRDLIVQFRWERDGVRPKRRGPKAPKKAPKL